MAKKDIIYLFVCRADKRKKLLAEIEKKFPNIQTVNIHCAGRFNPILAFKLLQQKAIGIVLLGCDTGDCHYREGNLFSERRMLLAKETLNGFGLDGNRLHVLWYNPKQIDPIIKSLEAFSDYLADLASKGDSK